ncbi:hypothetical protein VKT23_013258 [Stygiomarasmius scandens]|uniref:Uncharacterized protein n=1 Tax=Marasmiellus scandens TaxID=2682957 RepID=A0ABR1J4M0_9AGAR
MNVASVLEVTENRDSATIDLCISSHSERKKGCHQTRDVTQRQSARYTTRRILSHYMAHQGKARLEAAANKGSEKSGKKKNIEELTYEELKEEYIRMKKMYKELVEDIARIKERSRRSEKKTEKYKKKLRALNIEDYADPAANMAVLGETVGILTMDLFLSPSQHDRESTSVRFEDRFVRGMDQLSKHLTEIIGQKTKDSKRIMHNFDRRNKVRVPSLRASIARAQTKSPLLPYLVRMRSKRAYIPQVSLWYRARQLVRSGLVGSEFGGIVRLLTALFWSDVEDMRGRRIVARAIFQGWAAAQVRLGHV